jgi:hypothetical protein
MYFTDSQTITLVCISYKVKDALLIKNISITLDYTSLETIVDYYKLVCRIFHFFQ